MAKGNLLQGYARGSVGDVVFSRVKGQQIAKARNRQPANPRTKVQMYQRSIFISAVKFFSRGNQNQFKFAYEDRKTTESDYNAFMRINAKNGTYLTKGMADNPVWPSIGYFTMSKGSLSPVKMQLFKRDHLTALAVAGFGIQDGAAATVAQLSDALKMFNPQLMNGQIVTFFTIRSTAQVDTTGEMSLDSDTALPQWSVYQVKIDTTDNTELPWTFVETKDGAQYITITGEGGNLYIDEPNVEQTDSQYVSGFGVIVSQNTPNGLKVSTCELELNERAKKVYNYYTSTAWKELCAADWGASQTAVLQGGLLENQD